MLKGFEITDSDTENRRLPALFRFGYFLSVISKKREGRKPSLFEMHLQIGEAHATVPDLTRYPFATYLIKLVKHTPPHL